MSIDILAPDWPAPAKVRAAATTRTGGVSKGPYASLNLGAHVGDDPAAVAQNRARLVRALALPSEPRWLNQIHGTCAADASTIAVPCDADASFARESGVVCAVLTADCLPVLFCDRAGTRVAAAHAGWRGLAGGVLESTVRALGGAPGDLMAWLGPAIGPEAFEVGDEVRATFIAEEVGAEVCFRRSAVDGRWLADLYGLARLRLARAGVHRVYGGGLCTFADSARFYSYRRDGRTGRQATLVWLTA